MAASRLVFLVQVVVTLLVLAFGVTVWFTATDANLKSVGSGFVAYILGFWTSMWPACCASSFIVCSNTL